MPNRGGYSKPANLEAERMLLGSVLLSEDAAPSVISSIELSDFSGLDERNTIIYKAMLEIVRQGHKVDVASVTDELRHMHAFEDAGGIEYLKLLMDAVISLDDIDHYIKIIKNDAVLASFLDTMQKAQAEYQTGKVTDPGDFIAYTNQQLSEIASRRRIADFKSASVLAEEVSIELQQEMRRDNKGLTGVDTGYPRLNSFTHGWQKGTLNILAARPAVGKSALALNFAYKSAESTGCPVAFFSCEMSGGDIMRRLLAAKAILPLDKITTGLLNERERVKLWATMEDIKKTHLFFDDTPNIKLSDLVAKSTKLKKDYPNLALIIVDYIGLITVEGRYDSRTLEIAQITKTLKQLARDLEIPVIALAQLNRDIDKAPGSHKPTLANLRESGSIEQDADLVILMHRADYYAKDKAAGKSDAEPSSYSARLQQQLDSDVARGGNKDSISVTDLILAKNRSGRTGEISLLFSKALQLFDTPSPSFESARGQTEGISIGVDDE